MEKPKQLHDIDSQSPAYVTGHPFMDLTGKNIHVYEELIMEFWVKLLPAIIYFIILDDTIYLWVQNVCYSYFTIR